MTLCQRGLSWENVLNKIFLLEELKPFDIPKQMQKNTNAWTHSGHNSCIYFLLHFYMPKIVPPKKSYHFYSMIMLV